MSYFSLTGAPNALPLCYSWLTDWGPGNRKPNHLPNIPQPSDMTKHCFWTVDDLFSICQMPMRNTWRPFLFFPGLLGPLKGSSGVFFLRIAVVKENCSPIRLKNATLSIDSSSLTTGLRHINGLVWTQSTQGNKLHQTTEVMKEPNHSQFTPEKKDFWCWSVIQGLLFLA